MKKISCAFATLALVFGTHSVALAGTDETAEPGTTLEEVTVTARKREESANTVPITITELDSHTLTEFKIDSFDDYATKIPNLSFAYGTNTPGFSNSRTVAIRGVVGTNATGFYIDDTPIVDSMDPRVLDIDRIEVLKGPQGTLYGSGSMGGTVRLITAKPDLEKDSGTTSGSGGVTDYAATPDYAGSTINNFVVVPRVFAIRAVGYYDHEGGYLTRTYPDTTAPSGLAVINNQGVDRSYGGSITGLMKFTDEFSSTLRVMFQKSSIDGWPAPYAPLPCFCVTSFTLNRQQNLQETADDKWALPSLELAYDGGNWRLFSSTSYFWRRPIDFEDSTEGSKQVLSSIGYTPQPGPILWNGFYNEDRTTEETRLTFSDVFTVSGVIGVYWSHLRNHNGVPASYLPDLAAQGLYPNNLDYLLDNLQESTDKAVFSEIYVPIGSKLTLTLGARGYEYETQSTIISDGFLAGGYSNDRTPKLKENGVSPKFGLDYKVTPDTMVYTTVARGFRPGGNGLTLPNVCDSGLSAIGYTTESASQYSSDTLWSYEVGAKSAVSRRVNITGALFEIDWSKIQQSIYLPSCGFPFEGNAGKARIRGGEIEATAKIIDGLAARVDYGYDNSKILDAGVSPLIVGDPIYQVPENTASIGLSYEHSLTRDLLMTISTDYSYVGSSLSANSSSAMPLMRPAYEIVNARIAFALGASELALYGKNLGNEKANLGDLVFNGFPQTTVLNGNTVPYPRVATLRPLQMGVQYTWRY